MDAKTIEDSSDALRLSQLPSWELTGAQRYFELVQSMFSRATLAPITNHHQSSLGSVLIGSAFKPCDADTAAAGRTKTLPCPNLILPETVSARMQLALH